MPTATVILTACEGDEPGVQMNLYHWSRAWGSPRLLSGVGLQDPTAPATQDFAGLGAERDRPSAADGSKISFGQIVANATGSSDEGMSRGKYTGDVMRSASLRCRRGRASGATIISWERR